MLNLSVCTISRNEEEDMPGFLEHLLPWVKEIVIVDDNSTDGTWGVVKKYGEKVNFIVNEMGDEKDFASQRNLCIEHATGDWILHMDVDERVTPELARSIKENIAVAGFDAFRYRRLNHFLHYPVKGGGWHHWNRIQLAKRGNHHFKNKVHEECVLEVEKPRLGQLDGYMWHLIDRNYSERLSKNITYSQLTAERLLTKVKKVRWYHLFFHPLYRAIDSYFLKKGYRDGLRGLIFAQYTYISTFNWWVCAWEKQNGRTRTEIEQLLKIQWDNNTQNLG